MKIILPILITTVILLILTCPTRAGFRVRRRRRSPPPPNQAPRFTYCPSSWTISTSALTTTVAWRTPTATDENSTPTVTQTSGHALGTTLGQGRYSVSYLARDSHGSTASCSFTFTVEVIRCPSIPAASNRWHSCTYGVQGGSQCTFACYTGYRLTGTPTVHCSTTTRRWSTAYPTCSVMTCEPPLSNPAHGIVSCTDDNRYTSICFFTCARGYEIPPGQVAARYCNGISWSGSQPGCQDVEPPVFSVCPSSFDVNVSGGSGSTQTVVITYDTPQATDNSGHVSTEMVMGKSSGSRFGNGVTTVKYRAEDLTGNRIECTFNVNVVIIITG